MVNWRLFDCPIKQISGPTPLDGTLGAVLGGAAMKFFLFLFAVIGIGTVVGFAAPTFNAPTATAAEPEGEVLGTASQLMPGDRDSIHAGIVAGAEASLQVARRKGQPFADAISITSDPPDSMRMVLPLPDGGQLNFLISLEAQGSSTLITQKVTMSGDVSAEMRSHLEGMRSAGTFNMLAAGQIPPLA
jgi:hypothetical protein